MQCTSCVAPPAHEAGTQLSRALRAKAALPQGEPAKPAEPPTPRDSVALVSKILKESAEFSREGSSPDLPRTVRMHHHKKATEA